MHFPSIHSDSQLETLFSALPTLCIVLLKDIDAIGLKRQAMGTPADDDESEESKSGQMSQFQKPGGCTLSGVLNILDGVASQEGRIVLMTSNFADQLDEALIRPGRIDKQIFLGHLSPETAAQMFTGMFAPTDGVALESDDLVHAGNGLRELALEFSKHIQE